ncbi:MAG: redoxin family protein [Alphaproteobacteria bacterium]
MHWLNTILLTLIICAGYGLTILMNDDAPPPPAQTEYESLPSFSITDLSGQKHTIETFKGKIILLNFWATWCAPCVKEFPALLEIAAENKKDVILIALSSDMDDDAIKKFLKKMPKPGKNVIIARDSDDITLKSFGITQFPETIIADRQLNKREKLIGAEWQPETLQKIIDSLKR